MNAIALDPRLGRSNIDYRDPGAHGWLILAGGIALFIAGVIIAMLMMVDPPKRFDDDAWAAVGLGAVCLVSGIVLFVLSIRDLIRKPVWHLCDQGAVRVCK